MKVNVDDLIRARYLQPAEIAEEDVIGAVFHEDMKKIIPLDQDYKVIYFAKKKNNHYLFVDGRWSSPNLVISAVFKVLSSSLNETATKNPLIILQRLAEECGYEVQIGDQRSKFIFDASISIGKIHSENEYNQLMSQIVKIHGLESSSNDVLLKDQIVRWREGVGDHDFVDVAFAYAISSNKYHQYLSNNNLI